MKAWLTLVLALLVAPWAHAQPDSVSPAFQTALEDELRRLEQALDGRMGIALFRTDDPTIRAFISNGILQVTPEAYLRLEAGLAAVAVANGLHNNQPRPMCYVLLNAQKAVDQERHIYAPMAEATGDHRQGAAYLAAHETAHCLDHLGREPALGRRMVWQADQAAEVGIHPEAFRRLYGNQAATAAYKPRLTELYGDMAQRQYEERIADAFAMLWLWRLGAPEQVRTLLHDMRAHDQPHTAHYTAPVLARMAPLQAQASQASMDQLWAMARQIQREVDVDPSLGPGSKLARNPVSEAIEALREQTPSNRPASRPPPSRHWNDLPRFGAPNGR